MIASVCATFFVLRSHGAETACDFDASHGADADGS